MPPKRWIERLSCLVIRKLGGVGVQCGGQAYAVPDLTPLARRIFSTPRHLLFVCSSQLGGSSYFLGEVSLGNQLQ
ncbi:hypothetical protein DPEC_G00344120 [Dallia pectoralis]|uniref:Uncharacterized protein n=1 Tax=Dallia pectoralis TaxID=75939 RepID=A0ACC2F369_DALPE|nr:hypothetical protein DPEC_G00344120 [Dallia pectoralis]